MYCMYCIIIILLQECVSSFYSGPQKIFSHAGVNRFSEPSLHLSRSWGSNLCKPLAIMSRSSTSFHLFFVKHFLTHHFVSALPLLGLFFHPFSPHAPAIETFILAEILLIFPHPLFHESSHNLIIHFVPQGFSKYHSQHSHFCRLHFSFIFHSQCPTFRAVNESISLKSFRRN